MQNVKRDITTSYSMLATIYKPISTYFTLFIPLIQLLVCGALFSYLSSGSNTHSVLVVALV